MPESARTGVDLARVRRAVADRPPVAMAHPLEFDRDQLRPAAVLIPLFEEAGEARVILTRRSDRLRSHSGQVSFPGGRIEPGEASLTAALRETHEEIGLEPGLVEIVGELSPLATLRGGSAIQPFVGALASRPALLPNPSEVDRVFDVALADLMAEGVHHEERWDVPGLDNRDIHFFDLPDDLVWGATARILVNLLMLILRT